MALIILLHNEGSHHSEAFLPAQRVPANLPNVCLPGWLAACLKLLTKAIIIINISCSNNLMKDDQFASRDHENRCTLYPALQSAHLPAQLHAWLPACDFSLPTTARHPCRPSPGGAPAFATPKQLAALLEQSALGQKGTPTGAGGVDQRAISC